MIAALRSALATAGYDPTPEELADILWLAVQPDSGPLRQSLGGEPLTVSGPAVPSLGRGSSDAQMTGTGQADSCTLYASVDWSEAVGAAVSPTRIPTPRALTQARVMTRALRPLRSMVPSRTRFHLDIAATVAALADGFNDIVLTPTREPSLDLTLVVDDGISMAVWHDVAKELHQELHRLKAFRRTRLVGMNTDDPERVWFTAEPFRHSAATVHPAVGNRCLVVFLTDGVGQAWQTGKAQEYALLWAAKASTAVFQVLPEDMWPGTGLPTLRLMASAPRPAVPNRHIRLRHPRLPRGLLPLPSPPIPVIDIMRGTSARAWAQLVGAPAGESALHFYDPDQLSTPAPFVPGDAAAEPSAEDALEEFLAYASDNARRLAAHLASAGTALSVPLMRLVQHSAVPGSGPEHLAEVFLAGMLTAYTPVTADGGDPLPHEAMPWDRRSFAFPPAVAESLRELVRRSDERATHQYVTEYLEQQHRATQAGAALVADPHGALRARADLPLGSAVPGRPVPQGGQLVSLASLTQQLNPVLDRIRAPRLDWVHEAVATSGSTDISRVVDLIAQAVEQGRTAADLDDYAELQRVLETLAQELGQTAMATAYRQALAALQSEKPAAKFPSSARTAYDDSSEPAPYFYLSYAHTPRGDASALDPNAPISRLFRDLNDHIRNLTGPPSDRARFGRGAGAGLRAGFMDRSTIGVGQPWSEEMSDALATCRVFVPLYSPRYFTSNWCGREWAAFTHRRSHLRFDNSRSPSAIVPILWTPIEARDLPLPAQQLQFVHPDLGERYHELGLYGLTRIASFRTDYQRAVYRLAQRIVEVAESVIVEPASRDDVVEAPDAFAPPSSDDDTEEWWVVGTPEDSDGG
ncbi:TIR-like protein FxsC [Streptomyces sp. NPDC046931]|uniref:TIR-like protein FxsC n=1 Tax=Streptomyces sp. NPDC046931 TaxID=3154806 RepID=UPI0033D9F7A3